MVSMELYLVVSTFMMFVGIYGFFTRRNLLAMLISVELILNSVDINFAVFNRFLFPGQLEGIAGVYDVQNTIRRTILAGCIINSHINHNIRIDNMACKQDLQNRNLDVWKET